ncbi:HipA domain-containing protein [Mesorhizobium sp. B2-4-19]|uniref:HipA domain-containing protein n=1 Tax=Mesorhizobium sp. B2-4-19 TaxID=2589930 RepID=UPI0032B2D433
MLKRALFAWLIADGDMHLKNLALLKIAEPNSSQFDSVNIAPLYDAATTRVFPNLEGDRMALKLNGKDERLRRSDFRSFAATAGIRAIHAKAVIDDLVTRLRAGLEGFRLPGILPAGSTTVQTAERMRSLVTERLNGFA